MKVTIEPNLQTTFNEGDIVCAKDDPLRVYIVTVAAEGSGPNTNDDVFWAINLFGNRVSGGNYRKDLFQKFSGKITMEC